MRNAFRGKSEMNLFTKWMTLLFSIIALAGCGESEKFYGDTATDDTPVVAGEGYTLTAAVIGPKTMVVATTTVIQAVITDTNGTPVEGATVAFEAISGDFAGAKYRTAPTNADGIVNMTLSAPVVVGTDTITVTSSDQSQTIGMTYLAGAPTILTISASPARVGVSADSTLTSQLLDFYGNPLVGETMLFEFVDNQSGATIAGTDKGYTQTNANGTATITYTSGSTAGKVDTITVKPLNYAGITNTTIISIDAAATIISTLDFSIDTAPTSIVVGSTPKLLATVRDNEGAAVPGVDVLFEVVGAGYISGAKVFSATTGPDGTASATLSAPTLVGAATLKVSTSGLSKSITANYIPSTPAIIAVDASSKTLGTNTETSISAKVSDAFGNVTPNEAVTFTITVNNSGATLTPYISKNPYIGTASTDSLGFAYIAYTSGAAANVSDTIQAKAQTGTNPKATVKVAVTSSSTSVGSVAVTAGSGNIIADGTDSTTIRAEVKDNTGAPMSGQTVTFVTTAGQLTSGVSTGATVNVNTDADGFAFATLESSISTGTAAITATLSGYNDSTTVAFVPGSASQIMMYASPTTLSTGSEFIFEAIVMDVNNNRLFGEMTTFYLKRESTAAGVYDVIVNSFGEETDDTGRISSSFGVFDVYALVSGATTLELSAVTTNGTTTKQIITIDNTINLGGIAVTPVSPAITADGTSITALRAYVLDINSSPVQGISVGFTTDEGVLQNADGVVAASALTDANGMAEIYLRSTVNLATATVVAKVGVGFSATTTVGFVAGVADAAKSSLTASPSTLPADGATTSTITVTLADKDGHPVADGSPVTLLGMTGDAVVTSANPTSTISGRATFILQAASSSATDALYLAENASIAGNIVYGATGTGEPANIQVSSAQSQITVAGVGMTENTTITVTVVDEGGSLIADPAADNLRIALLTRPHGGEYISGENFAGNTVTSLTTLNSYIDLATSSGQAVFNLQSGIYPGVVEIMVMTLGYATNPSAIVPQIVISSGPAHTINLTSPVSDSVENLGGGVYKRIGTAIVSDQHGNAVPDGTVVNYGILDTVLANDDDGNTAAGQPLMQDDGTGSGGVASLDTDFVIRNGTPRFIQSGDRLLITNARAEDKSRHISTVDGFDLVSVQKGYVNKTKDLNYVIGYDGIGGQIFGVDDADTKVETKGWGTTLEGQTTFYVKYPANAQTISVGCGIAGYACSNPVYQTSGGCTGAIPAGTWGPYRDERYEPNSSAEVYVVAGTSEGTKDSAVTVDQGQFCFAAIAGGTLTAIPEALVGDGTVTLSLVDGGDGIALPFRNVTGYVTIDSRAAGTCTDSTKATEATCLEGNEVWDYTAGTCSDLTYSDELSCVWFGSAVWTPDADACSDGASLTQVSCVANNEVWTPDTFDIATTNLSCITDNPGTFSAGDGVSGSCTATVDVIGSNWQSGDSATITWYAAGASASATVTIP